MAFLGKNKINLQVLQLNIQINLTLTKANVTLTEWDIVCHDHKQSSKIIYVYSDKMYHTWDVEEICRKIVIIGQFKWLMEILVG